MDVQIASKFTLFDRSGKFREFRTEDCVMRQAGTLTTTRRSLLLQIGAALICVAAVLQTTVPTVAQSWPQRNVRFIVPLGPGSGTDITARLFARRRASGVAPARARRRVTASAESPRPETSLPWDPGC